MTKTDIVFESLRILGINSYPTDVQGLTAWYHEGRYLGLYTMDSGYDFIKRCVMVGREELSMVRH